MEQGYVEEIGGKFYVNINTCNGSCTGDAKDDIKEGDVCCKDVRILLCGESQDKVSIHDIILFEILSSVDAVDAEWKGLYGRYVMHVGKDCSEQVGSEATAYSSKYKGTLYHSEILKAIEFGCSLAENYNKTIKNK